MQVRSAFERNLLNHQLSIEFNCYTKGLGDTEMSPSKYHVPGSNEPIKHNVVVVALLLLLYYFVSPLIIFSLITLVARSNS